jgi:ribulose bisphosphate carboxylase small subunit
MRQAAKLARVTRTHRRKALGATPEALPVEVAREKTDAERDAEAQAAEAVTLLDRLASHHAQQVQRYIEHSKGVFEPETGRRLTDREIEAQARADVAEGRKWAAEHGRKTPTLELSWHDLGAIAEEDAGEALAKWEAIKQAARDEYTSGLRTADAAGEHLRPFERARFVVLHEQLAEGWQPRNGVEHSLVDMLALTFSLYLHWTQIAHSRAVGCIEDLRDEDKKTGYWPRPTQDAADAIEQAQRLADGYHRQYMRTLRQMRDLRRYSTPPSAPSVFVNQGGQINVASQQVNVKQ